MTKKTIELIILIAGAVVEALKLIKDKQIEWRKKE
jgi:hypothetical protein